MVQLNNITEIDAPALELLEASGFRDIEALANAEVSTVHQELRKANALLQVMQEDISRAQVEQWVGEAQELWASGGAESELVAVDYEASPEVQAMLAGSPHALPLPARVLVENQMSVSQIPVGHMLNHYVGDLDVRVNPSAPPHPDPAVAGPRTLQAANSTGQPSRQELLRSPKPSTNKGKNPESRWYIRGVLHTNPYGIYFAAFLTLCLFLILPASVISAALLILSSELPETLGWVPKELLAIPASLPLFGIGYLIWGLNGKCRICNQKIFVHRTHLKNSKAHHVWGLGYVFPLCVHLLIFRWFRCTHCGTAARVKE